MSTWFYIAPYTLEAWQNAVDANEKPQCDLSINPAIYRAKLSERWSSITNDSETRSGCSISWELPPEASEYAGLWGCLQDNQQIVALGTGPKRSFIDFILWHRSFVSSNYQLFLFNASDRESFELKPETSEAEIVTFTGIIS